MSRTTFCICLLAALAAALGTAIALTWDPGPAPPSGETAPGRAGAGLSLPSGSGKVQRSAIGPPKAGGEAEVSISGSVENGEGQPVAGARVELRRHGGLSEGASEDQALSSEADGGGQFAFSVASPGAYQLVASAGDATREVVVIAPVAAVRIVLRASSPSLLDSDLTIHVVDARSRRPVEGAEVVVWSGAVGAAALATGRTDVDGACRLDVGPVTDVRVVATLQDGRCGMTAAGRDPRNAPLPDTVVAVGASGGLAGDIVAPNGIPADLQVFAQPEPVSLGVRHSARVMRSSSGVRYVIEGLPAGAYSVAIESAANVRVLRKNNTGALLRDPGHSGFMNRMVGLVRSGVTAELDLELATAATVQGRVLDTAGASIARAEVSVVRVLGKRRSEERWVDGRPVDLSIRAEVADRDLSALLQTGAQGRYSLHGLQPGLYRVAAFADDRTSNVLFDVSLVAGQTVDLEHRLARSGALGGAVHGRPLLRVTAANGAEWLTRADAHGAFAIDRLPVGKATVAAVDYTTARRANRTGDPTPWRVLGDVQVAAGREGWIDLRSSCEVRLQGFVRSGKLPVAGATVQVAGVAARSGDDGKFTIRMAAPPTHWDAWVWWNGFRWRSKVRVQASGTDEWSGDIQLGPFGLDLEVVDGSGRPAPATVKLRSTDGRFTGSMDIDVGGRDSAAYLGAGKLAVEATFENGATVSRQLEIPADAAVKLVRPEVGALEVAIADRGGRPQHRVVVLVSAWTGSGPVPDPFPTRGDRVRTTKALTDFRGIARFDSVPAGDVFVQFRTGSGVASPQPVQLSLARGETRSLSVEVAASGR